MRPSAQQTHGRTAESLGRNGLTTKDKQNHRRESLHCRDGFLSSLFLLLNQRGRRSLAALTGTNEQTSRVMAISSTRLFSGLLIAGLASLQVSPALAQSAALGDVYACAEKADDAARLACFDAAVRELKADEASGEVRAVTRTEVEAVERDAFGFNLPSLPRLRGLFGGSDDAQAPRKAEALTAPVQRRETRSAEATPPPAPLPKSVSEVVLPLRKVEEFGANGRYRFFLANGQVWDQADKTTIRIPRNINKSDTHTVEIRRAAMGSYLLRIDGKGVAIRARRRR